MASGAVQAKRREQEGGKLPPLEAGDHLDQATFHARYQATPEGVKAELVEGVVYMPSPTKVPHGEYHALVMGWLFNYWTATPGTLLLDNATTVLGDESEPQPDAALIILPECGGRTTVVNDYVTGPPELAVEVVSSTVAYDLHSKRRDYERHGVGEYLAVVLWEEELHWWRNVDGRFEAIKPGDDGIVRSTLFPGLWLDPAALLYRKPEHLLEVLKEGLATPEHDRFVKELAARRAS